MAITLEIQRLKDLQKDIQSKFEIDKSDSRSIHSVSSISFYTHVLNADSFCLNILSNGWKVPFKEEVESISQYFEPNNKSCVGEELFISETLAKWELLGRVKKVHTPPLLTNPLSVVQKTDLKTSETKKRLVIDVSRYLNPLIANEKVKPDNLDYSEPFIKQFDFMMSFDLKDMYHHVKLSPGQEQYFGFLFNDQFFVFTVLMFGVNYAVFLTDRLIKPIKSFIQTQNIHLGIFIDDGRVISSDSDLCEAQFQFVLFILQTAGWTIQWKKTSSVPSQSLLYLGLVTDTIVMKYFTPDYKITYVRDLIEIFLSHIAHNRSFPATELAALLGKLAAMIKSHGNLVKVLTRHGQHLLGKHVIEHGWDVRIHGDEHLAGELRIIRDQLFLFNGHSIKSTLKPITVFSQDQVNYYSEMVPDSEISKPWSFFVSDSSDSHAYTYEAEQFDFVNDYAFNTDEKAFSSGLRELLAVKMALIQNVQYFSQKSGQVIYWLTDSKCNFAFLKTGSRKQYIQQIIMQIKEIEFKYNFQIIPIWAPRSNSHIQIADEGSKFSLSTDEWTFDIVSFHDICNQFQVVPTVDGFASSTNNRCEQFFSKIPQKNSSGVNFFAQQLTSKDIYYCCPPPKLIIYTFKHIFSFPNCKAIIVFPIWKSANFFNFVIHGQKTAPFVLQYKIFNPRFFAKHGLFIGYKNFDMMAVFVESGKFRPGFNISL